VLNAGWDGNTAADGLQRIERDVVRHDPDLVLLAFGLNDLKLRRTPDQLSTDLETMVQRLAAHGCEVVLLATNLIRAGIYSHLLRDYNTAIWQLARQNDLPLVDVAAAWKQVLDQNPAADLLSDVAHLTPVGQQVIADPVAALLGSTP